MGHYYADMFPRDAEEHSKLMSRLIKVKEQVDDMPLSAFTVGELESLLRVIRFDINKSAGNIDLERIEKAIERYKSK